MTMTAAEFTAARERLGWTHEQAAAEFDLTPAVVAAWERGTVKIPRDVAANVRWQAALEEQRVLLEASGLPKCEEMLALVAATRGKEGKQLIAAFEPIAAHTASCPLCRARDEYASRHGPPIPEPPMPLWVRAFGGFDSLVNRLPAPLRPAKGPAGEGRRTGLGIAAVLSLFVIGILVLASVGRVRSHGWGGGWWREPLTILAAVVPAYFVGLYLAGAAFDATRRVQHRFIGYVARGALALGAFYGTIGLVMPLMESDMKYSDVPIIAGGLAALGAVIGGVLWVTDRLRGKLPVAGR